MYYKYPYGWGYCMKKYKEIKENFTSLCRQPISEEGVRSFAAHADSLVALLKYLDNDHYVHFTKNSTAHGTVTGAKGQYLSTPKAVYAWQLNTYKKKLKTSIERGMQNPTTRPHLGIVKTYFYMNLDNIFPWAADRDNLIVLRAKSGLKWLRPLRTPEKEAREIYKVTQNFKKSDAIFIKHISLDELMEYVLNNNASFNTDEWLTKMEKERPELDRDLNIKGRASARAFLEEIYNSFWKSSITERNPKHRLGTVAWLAFREVVPSYDPIISGQILRRLGYDAFREDAHEGKEGAIFSNEPTQTGFLHSKAFKQVAVIENGQKGGYFIEESDFPRIKELLKRV